MIGLLKKDLYVADRTCRMLLVLAMAFSAIPQMSSFGTTYSMMLAVMVPLYCISYDEKSKWDRYAAMLPYTVGQLVWTKYLMAYIFALLAMAIFVLGGAVRSIINPGSFHWQEFRDLGLMLLIVAVFTTDLSLPMLYRFGTEKGRLAMIMSMGVGVGIALGVAGIFGELPVSLPRLPLGAVIAITAVLAVAATCGSFRLSVHFYRKRQNGAYN